MRLLPCIAAVLSVLVPVLRAGSLERLPVTPADVAAAAGVELTKYAFTYEKPVWLTVQLEVRTPGKAEVTTVVESSKSPATRTELAFTVYDRWQMRRAIGLPEPAAGEALLLTVLAPDISIDVPVGDPFASEDPERTATRFIRPVENRQPLPLDTFFSVYTKLGPFTPAEAKGFVNPRENFAKAPGFVRLAVMFSEKPPTLDSGAAPAGTFPLRVARNGRYLTGADGAPFLYQADTAWHLLWKATLADTLTYLDRRAEQGFSAIQMQLAPEGLGPADLTARGEPIFLAPHDVSQPNPAHFDHVAAVVREMAARNMLAVLNPAWLGCCEGGWRDHLKKAGTDACRRYGQFLGRRLKDEPNVLWLHGGDRDPGEWRPFIDAMAEGIRAEAPGQLHAAHAASTHSALDVYADAPWLDVNTTYTYSTDHQGAWTRQFHVYALSQKDWLRQPARPFFLVESTYEGEHRAPAQKIRRQAWWSVLSGSCGHALGNAAVWRWAEGWKLQLDSPASVACGVLAKTLRGNRWHEWVPDVDHTRLTAGYGTFNGSVEPGGDDFAPAAATPDGRTLVAYLPTARSITLDLGKLHVPARATWIDPTTGTTTTAGKWETASPVSLTPPTANAAGDSDWVLLVVGK